MKSRIFSPPNPGTNRPIAVFKLRFRLAPQEFGIGLKLIPGSARETGQKIHIFLDPVPFDDLRRKCLIFCPIFPALTGLLLTSRLATACLAQFLEFEVQVNPQLDGSEFVQLYSAYEARLRGYVQSLVPRWSDADDVMQRSNLVLWKKFSQYQPGSNFFAWACQIVRLEVLKFREGAARDKMIFTEAFLDAVDEHTVRRSDELQTRIDFLEQCVSRLSREHQELLRLCYDEQRTVVSIAEHLNRKVDGIYKTLSRIHLALYSCVSRRMAKVQP